MSATKSLYPSRNGHLPSPGRTVCVCAPPTEAVRRPAAVSGAIGAEPTRVPGPPRPPARPRIVWPPYAGAGGRGPFGNEGVDLRPEFVPRLGAKGRGRLSPPTPCRPPPPRDGRGAALASPPRAWSRDGASAPGLPGDHAEGHGPGFPRLRRPAGGASALGPGLELSTRLGTAAGAAGRRAPGPVSSGASPAGLAPASGPLCRLGEVGPRAERGGAGGGSCGLSWDSVATLPSPPSSCRARPRLGTGWRALLECRGHLPPPLCPVAFYLGGGHSRETFLRALLLARWPWTFSD